MSKLEDIAEKSGVSIATVSRILNNDLRFSVSEKTKKKVLSAANELEYIATRKQTAKAVTKKPNIGIVQMLPYSRLMDDPYYFKIENSIEEFKSRFEITTTKIINHQNGRFEFPEDSKLDGIFAIGKFDKREIDALVQISPNIVFIDSAPDDELYYGIVPNFQLAIEQAVKYFLEAGHTNIGFIGERYALGGTKNRILEPRRVFFESTMKTLNLYNEEYIIECEVNAKNCYEITCLYFSKNRNIPSAFFVATDTIASGVIRAVFEYGFKIPDDISIIAFNDTILSEHAIVPLTSISVLTEKMSIIALKNMQELLSGDGFPTKTVISCKLVERQSVKRLL